MEARFLLDTNICIYIRRKKPDPVLQRFRALKQGEAALSVIILGELLYGAEKSAQLAAALELLRELAQALSVMGLPDTAAEAYGARRPTVIPETAICLPVGAIPLSSPL